MRTLLFSLGLAMGCASARKLPFEERLFETLPEGALATSFRFSRDGRHLAYVRTSAGRDQVVVDAVAGKPLSLI